MDAHYPSPVVGRADFTAELARLSDLCGRVVAGTLANNYPLPLSEHERFSAPSAYRTFALEALLHLGSLGTALLVADTQDVSRACESLGESFKKAFTHCQPYFELSEPLSLLSTIKARAAEMNSANCAIYKSAAITTALDRDLLLGKKAETIAKAFGKGRAQARAKRNLAEMPYRPGALLTSFVTGHAL